MSEKKEKRQATQLPFTLAPGTRIKINLLRNHYNAHSMQDVLDEAVHEAFCRHYRDHFSECQKLEAEHGAIHGAQQDARPQG